MGFPPSWHYGTTPVGPIVVDWGLFQLNLPTPDGFKRWVIVMEWTYRRGIITPALLMAIGFMGRVTIQGIYNGY